MVHFIRNQLPHLDSKMFPHNTHIFLLYNYKVHVTNEVTSEIENRGYMPIFIGGGITGDMTQIITS